MSFHDVRFPIEIALGAEGGPGYNTEVIELDSGAEERIGRWSRARYKYNIGLVNKTPSELATLINFFHGRQGSLYSFRFKDYAEFTSAADNIGAYDYDDIVLGVGDASETNFQLVKKYTSGAVTRTRKITKPVSGEVKIGIDGVEQLSGWTVDTSTGVVTFGSPPGSGLDVTGGFEFDVETRFGVEVDKMLNLRFVEQQILSTESLALVEVIDEIAAGDEFYYGGAVYVAPSNDYTLSVSLARVYTIVPTTTGIAVHLPDPTNLQPGGPYFYLIASLPNFDVKDDGGTTLLTTSADTIYTVLLGKDSLGNKKWSIY